LDQGKLRGANRRFDAEAINLGNEPPLSADGGTGGLVDRRRVSVQWFSGTILTGLCGAALMGGAVFASLDGETNFAAAPERMETALRGAIAGIGRLSGIRKTDRLAAVTEPSVARQVVRVPTSSRVRDREMVRTRAFVRVAGTLSLQTSELSANIPAFNPQKLLTDSVVSTDDAPAAAEPDAEVTFVTCDLVPSALKNKVSSAVCDLNSLLAKVKPSTLLPLDEIVARVRDVASKAPASPPLLASAEPSATPGLRLNYAAEGDTDPYVGFAARIVPENITLLPKTTGGSDWSEHVVVAKKGETIGSILRELGASIDEIKSILAILNNNIKEGQKLRVLTAAVGLGHMQPLRIIVASDNGIEAAAAISDTGKYVAVDVRNIDASLAGEDDDQSGDDDGSGVRLYRASTRRRFATMCPGR
jgi:hypothetical protein